MRWIDWLQDAEILSAFISAAFWLLSAKANAPLMTWAGVGDLPAFLSQVSRYNFVASMFAGLAAILAALARTLHVA
jgi:hypothetical protein